MSEKLDGHRAFWDGGITLGMVKADVPWANCVKDTAGDLQSPATGLWSRYGNIIHAPSWFTDGLPRGVMLDGELWAGYAHRQDLPIKGHAPTFNGVRYLVYDIVPPSTFSAVRTYRCTGYKVTTRPWVKQLDGIVGGMPFLERYEMLASLALGNHARLLEHQRITSLEHVSSRLDYVLTAGGEGLVLKGNRPYVCDRSRTCLKVKPTMDMEGVLVGYVAGEETDKGSRLLGMIGSLLVQLPNGSVLALAGLTDADRVLHYPHTDVAHMHPGSTQQLSHGARLNSTFVVGDHITFRYRGLTRDGLPMEARYSHVRHIL
jgi:DNA ligase-1